MNSSQEMTPRRRVAVVGAGQGGISTAIALLVQDYLKDAEDQMLALEFGVGAAPGSAS